MTPTHTLSIVHSFINIFLVGTYERLYSRGVILLIWQLHGW